MPRYCSDISEIIYEDEWRRLYKACHNDWERTFLSIVYLSGARTSEILSIKREHIQFNDTVMSIFIHTLKLRKHKKKETVMGQDENGKPILIRQTMKDENGKPIIVNRHKICDRTIQFAKPNPPLIDPFVETICIHISTLKAGEKVIKQGWCWANKFFNRIGMQVLGKKLCPYHARHSRFSILAANGYSIFQLKELKGSDTLASVEGYIKNVPFVIKMQGLRTTKKDIMLSVGEGAMRVIAVETKKLLNEDVDDEETDEVEEEVKPEHPASNLEHPPSQNDANTPIPTAKEQIEKEQATQPVSISSMLETKPETKKPQPSQAGIAEGKS